MSQEAADDSKYVECIFELFRTEVDLKTFEPFWHIFYYYYLLSIIYSVFPTGNIFPFVIIFVTYHFELPSFSKHSIILKGISRFCDIQTF